LPPKQSDVKSLSKGKRFRATKRAEPTKELMFMQKKKKKKNVCAKEKEKCLCKRWSMAGGGCLNKFPCLDNDENNN
jgi:hypothetical protein